MHFVCFFTWWQRFSGLKMPTFKTSFQRQIFWKCHPYCHCVNCQYTHPEETMSQPQWWTLTVGAGTSAPTELNQTHQKATANNDSRVSNVFFCKPKNFYRAVCLSMSYLRLTNSSISCLFSWFCRSVYMRIICTTPPCERGYFFLTQHEDVSFSVWPLLSTCGLTLYDMCGNGRNTTPNTALASKIVRSCLKNITTAHAGNER